jgi:hypothetical protein
MNLDKWDTSQNVSNFNAKSITPSGFFGESDKNIVEVENFITEEEQSILLEFMKKNSSFDDIPTEYNENGTLIYDDRPWANRVATTEQLLKNGAHDIIEILNIIVSRFKPIIENFFEVECFATGPALVRWPVGARQEPHADKEFHSGPEKGRSNDFPWYDLAGLFYFNDDYEGGELYFPQHGIEFQPVAGAAYFFPGDMNYTHGVRPVKAGNRFTSPFFWTIQKHTGEKQP